MSAHPGVLVPVRTTLLMLAVAAVGCRDAVAPTAAPSIGNVTAVAEPDNVLSAELRFTARNADSVRAVWDDGNGDTGATPFVETKSGPSRVVVLGLLASHRYAMAIEARGGAA